MKQNSRGTLMKESYFEDSEFDSPDAPGSGKQMQDSCVRKLNFARGFTEKTAPEVIFRINSGFRTAEHNEAVGGVPNSAHTKGHAADIDVSWMTPAQVAATMMGLTAAGFRRIGFAEGSFIHVDDDPDKPSPATWDYSDAEHKA